VTEPRVPKTFRLPLSLVRELETVSELAGVPQTRYAEQGLRLALATAGEGSGGASQSVEPSWEDGRAADGVSTSHQPDDEVDLAVWLAERTGNPRSLCRYFIGRGRITVGGSVCSELVVRRSQLDTIALDGNPLE
jgi:hypothetical protein